MGRVYRTSKIFLALILPLFYSLPSNAIDIREVKSKMGVTAWLVENQNTPVISVAFTFRSGSISDPVGKEGRASFVAAMLDQGAGDLDAESFQARLEDLSISLRFNAGIESFSGTLYTLKKNSSEAFNLLSLALTKPRFEKKTVRRVREQIIARLKSNLERPEVIASRAWYNNVFKNHAYGRPVGGSVGSLTKVSVQDLRQFVLEKLTKDKLIIGVSGSISASELSLQLDKIFGVLPVFRKEKEFPKPNLLTIEKPIVIKRDVPQSTVIFGQLAVQRNHPDWYATYIMNRILGGRGFSSRLMEEIREKRGLAYGVSSWLRPFEKIGLITGNVATKNSRVNESLKIIKDEWRKAAVLGFSNKELENAKKYINGSFPLTLTSTRKIAGVLANIQYNRLGINYLTRRRFLINSVTLDHLNRVAKRILSPSLLSIVIVGEPTNLSSIEVPMKTPYGSN